MQPCDWLQLEAANGLTIPYLGYIELDLEVLGKALPKIGVLVVKDSWDPTTRQQKMSVPGLLGMNAISRCYQELFEEHGQDLFQSVSTDCRQWLETSSIRMPNLRTTLRLWQYWKGRGAARSSPSPTRGVP